MSGTKLGGKAAAETNKLKYGSDFYSRIGAMGGKMGKTGGFASMALCYCDYTDEPHRYARCAGSKGGKISRRQ